VALASYHITNDPVMTPELLDYFFNQRTSTFQQMDRRQIALLHSIYRNPEYQACLPPLTQQEHAEAQSRRHPRYTLHCPAKLTMAQPAASSEIKLDVIDVSMEGFQAEAAEPVPLETWCQVEVELGRERSSRVTAVPCGAAIRRPPLCGLSPNPARPCLACLHQPP